MLDAQPGTLLATILGGAATVLAQIVPGIDPVTQWATNLSGLGLLIWMVLRQDATRKHDREQCEQAMQILKEQVRTLWDTLHKGKGE